LPAAISPHAATARYRGRFAPSPTGPLHFGSLVAAVGSYLSARRAGGDWLLRIEDLDPPRTVAGSADQILAALEAFGFEWQGPVVHQSRRSGAYQHALEKLKIARLAFDCTCSRAEIEAAQPLDRARSDELYYPGWCRTGRRAPERAASVRFRTENSAVSFVDQIQGPITIDVAQEVGDFVIRRRDGLYAYQLAVVVDDADAGITHVVRGADLLNSTPRQILLQQALGLETPEYAHLPVATDRNGIKLSKSAGAAGIDLRHTGQELWRALHFLRQQPPSELRLVAPSLLWTWAIEHWQPDSLRGVRELSAGSAP
jgi:glutamyl-Q tRNA(Asp) synthetase